MRLFCILFIIFFFGCDNSPDTKPALNHSGIKLTFNVNAELEMSGKENEEKSYEMELVLGSTFIESQFGEGSTIYDFENTKIYQREENTEGFYERSLFSDIAFRVFEFENRFFMKEAFENLGIKDEDVAIKTTKDTIFIEHNFSLRSEENTHLQRTEEDGRIYFRHDDFDLLSYSSQLSAAPADKVVEFVLFLRYRFGIHPDILDELKTLSGIPKSITVSQYDRAVLTTNLDLVSLQELESVTMPEINSIFSPDEKLYEVIALAKEITEQDYQLAKKEMLELAVSKAEEEKYFDSMGLFSTYNFAFTTESPKELREFQDRINVDRNVRAYERAVEASSKKDLEIAQKNLIRLIDEMEDGQNAPKIMLASITDALGDRSEAERLFLEVLEENPFIVGAWTDLGGIYFKGYQMDKAWHCWDTARKLNSDHPFVTTVDGLEDQLRERNPDYFMAN